MALSVTAREPRPVLVPLPTAEEPDDVTLAAEAAKGDPGAHAAIWDRYAPLVRRILDRLDANGRLAFVLQYVDGWELTEVADAFGVSLATVKRRLARVSVRVFASAQADGLLVQYLGDEKGRTP